MRRDGAEHFARLLDTLCISPGFDLSEGSVGTTATNLALFTGSDITLAAAEHYHPLLAVTAEAASVVRDLDTGDTLGAVTVVVPAGHATEIPLTLARILASRLSELIAREPTRRAQAVFEAFTARSKYRSEWVVATDGAALLLNDAATTLDPSDQKFLSDTVIGSLALHGFASFEANTPSGLFGELTFKKVLLDGEIVGSILAVSPPVVGDSKEAEALRRQGAHVTPTRRRDYASDLRESGTTHSSHLAHAAEGSRDAKDLMTPYVRARHDIGTNIRNHHNHVVIGEAGVGKQSLVIAEFRAQHADGRILTADCTDFTGDTLPFRSASGGLFRGTLDDGPHLLLIGGLETLPPVGARRLDDILRPLAVGANRPLLIASVNEAVIDVSRPYGLVMRYFADTVRVPPLRLRIDDIGNLALEILGTLAGGSSLRLSHQAIRVLEGYSWPGNVTELEDVLRFVVARKPIGEVQARDLPAVCFQGSSRRLSMLESAQRDAIIQALYESKGNRYKAAAALGIARSSLYRKIDSFGISYIA